MLSNKENEAMKAFLFAAAFLTITSMTSLAENAPSTEPAHYSHSQIRSLIRSAKTPAEYLVLRNYYSQVAETDRRLAAEEKQEWDRRAANPVAYGRKYPSPVDSAHYLYDSYMQKAQASAEEAERYAKLAQTGN
jgi:hypothetical protein